MHLWGRSSWTTFHINLSDKCVTGPGLMRHAQTVTFVFVYFWFRFYLYLNLCDKCVTEADFRSKYLFKMTPDNVSSHTLQAASDVQRRWQVSPSSWRLCLMSWSPISFLPSLTLPSLRPSPYFWSLFRAAHFHPFSRPIKGRIRERGGKRATWWQRWHYWKGGAKNKIVAGTS